MDIVIADRGNTSNVIFIMSEDDVRLALKHPLVSLCTDSGASAEDGIFSQERSHPRAWGSAARILGRYVREEKLLPLEEAMRKMTSLPASRMGLADRGIVRPGMLADLVVFDPDTVQRQGHLRRPAAVQRGHPLRGGERPARRGRRPDHRGAARAGPLRPRLQGSALIRTRWGCRSRRGASRRGCTGVRPPPQPRR